MGIFYKTSSYEKAGGFCGRCGLCEFEGLRLVGGQTEVKASKYQNWQCRPLYLLRLLWILSSNCGNSEKAYV